ncbi:MAG: hypothetical protein MR878_01490 [Campylobacter sp.]|nr:hypothetical protein [Campylobacter sp.]
MTRNLEFLASVALLPRNDTENSRIPNLELLNLEFPKPCVIPRLDPWISSQRI